MPRRLAAILAADLVGYARLVHGDERATLAAVRAQRERMIAPRIVRHGGRIVKLMGDGLLAEFHSAVEAVHAAVEVQVALADEAQSVPDERRLRYRMGITIGNIVLDDRDIHGDGVNLAARLEALAEPDGVLTHAAVVDQLRGKLELTLEALGPRTVKGIAEPIALWRIVIDERARRLAALATESAPRRRARDRVLILVVATVLLLGAGAGAWWTRIAEPGAGSAAVPALPEPPPADDALSIAVLPFAEPTDGSDQEGLAEGMTQDVITDLAGLTGLRVIARNSTHA